MTNAPSRGDLVLDYLKDQDKPVSYAGHLQEKGHLYNGYNILLGDQDSLYYQSNRSAKPQALSKGLYGLSNALLDSSWPKVEWGKAGLAEAIKDDELQIDRIFDMLGNRKIAADEELPQTGIPYEWEKQLSAMHIQMEGYGTRVSTVLLIDYEGNYHVEERAHVPEGEAIIFGNKINKGSS